VCLNISSQYIITVVKFCSDFATFAQVDYQDVSYIGGTFLAIKVPQKHHVKLEEH
jgi:hypothetical protein